MADIAPAVYKAICAASAELATVGISKDKKNVQQGYSFRGIDDVYGALAPVLAKHNLCFLPRYTTRTSTVGQTKAGSAMYTVVVDGAFDIVCSVDGSKHTVCTYGEAMDTADKATNKAMSAAYKYAAFQAFCIPTEAHEDADATTPPPTAPPVPPQPPKEEKKVVEKAKLDPKYKAQSGFLHAKMKEFGVSVKDLKEWSSSKLGKDSSTEWDEQNWRDAIDWVLMQDPTGKGGE